MFGWRKRRTYLTPCFLSSWQQARGVPRWKLLSSTALHKDYRAAHAQPKTLLIEFRGLGERKMNRVAADIGILIDRWLFLQQQLSLGYLIRCFTTASLPQIRHLKHISTPSANSNRLISYSSFPGALWEPFFFVYILPSLFLRNITPCVQFKRGHCKAAGMGGHPVSIILCSAPQVPPTGHNSRGDNSLLDECKVPRHCVSSAAAPALVRDQGHSAHSYDFSQHFPARRQGQPPRGLFWWERPEQRDQVWDTENIFHNPLISAHVMGNT